MTYDIKLDSSGDIPVITSHITGKDLTIQRLRVRYQTFLGGYILDKSKGIPWINWLQDKPPNVASITAKLRAEATSCKGVDSVISMNGDFNLNTGLITISGELVIAGDIVIFNASSVDALANQVPMALVFTSGPIAGY